MNDDIGFKDLLKYYNSLPKCGTRDKVKAKINKMIDLDSTLITVDDIEPYLKLSRRLKQVYKYNRTSDVPNWLSVDSLKELVELGEKIEG